MSRLGRCAEKVPARGMQFLKLRSCGHMAVTIEDGKPVCGVHSSNGKASRVARAEKSQAQKQILHYARQQLRKGQKPTIAAGLQAERSPKEFAFVLEHGVDDDPEPTG